MNSIDNDTVVENHHPPSCGEEPADGEDALSKKGGSLILETAQSMGRVLDVDSNRGKSSSGGLEEHKYSWLESFFLACKIRFVIESRALITVLGAYAISVVFSLKDYGIIDLICKSLQWNRCFVTTYVARFWLWNVVIYTVKIEGERVSSLGPKELYLMIYYQVWGMIYAIVVGFAFPYQSSIIEGTASQSGLVKFSIMATVFLVNFMADTLQTLILGMGWSARKSQSNLQYTLCRKILDTVYAKVLSVSLLIVWFGSVASIAYITARGSLSKTLQVVLFGYCFPIIKSGMKSAARGYVTTFIKSNDLAPSLARSMALGVSSGTSTVAGALPLIVIFAAACSDTSFFLVLFVPAMIIDKALNLSYLPTIQRYILIAKDAFRRRVGSIHGIPSGRLRVKNSVVNVKGVRHEDDDDLAEEKPNDSVSPSSQNKGLQNCAQDIDESRKHEVLIAHKMKTIGLYIIGTSFGEGMAFFTIMLAQLPITKEWVTYTIGSVPTPAAPSPPSYSNILANIVGMYYVSDLILTIIVYTLFLQAGVAIKIEEFKTGKRSITKFAAGISVFILFISVGVV